MSLPEASSNVGASAKSPAAKPVAAPPAVAKPVVATKPVVAAKLVAAKLVAAKPVAAKPPATKLAPPIVAAASIGDPAEEAALRAAQMRADFSYKGHCMLVKVVEFYDGDTIRVVFAQPHGCAHCGVRGGGASASAAPSAPPLIQYKVRMNGYDSPEMRPLKTHPDREGEKKAAVAARAALVAKVGDDLAVMVCGDFDKYGRILATLYTRGGEDINAWMVANGYGQLYDGKTKKKWKDSEPEK